MTVWLVAQPTRGLWQGRVLARLTGTGVGAVVGAGLLVGFGAHSLWVLPALGSWLAICALVGNLLRHFRSYASVLAGYTASIIVLFGLLEGTAEPHLAWHRVLCTVIGVLASGLASVGMPQRHSVADLEKRTRGAVYDSLRWCEDTLENGRSVETKTKSDELLKRIAELEPEVDRLATGSLSSWMRGYRARCALADLVGLHAVVSSTPASTPAAWLLQRNVRHARDLSLYCHTLANVAKRAGLPVLSHTIQRLESTLERSATPMSIFRWTVATHDWKAAGRACARPVAALVIAASIWTSTAWNLGPVMVMTATLFASLFSSNPSGNTALRDVLVGSCLGAIGAIAFRILLVPYASDAVQGVLLGAPFLLLGAYLMSQRATAKLAIDMNMTFLLVAHPPLPESIGAPAVLEQAGATLAGVLIALAVYHWMLPANRASLRWHLVGRLDQLLAQIRACDVVRNPAALHNSISQTVLQILVLERGASAVARTALFSLASVAAGAYSNQSRGQAGPRGFSTSQVTTTAMRDGRGDEDVL